MSDLNHCRERRRIKRMQRLRPRKKNAPKLAGRRGAKETALAAVREVGQFSHGAGL